MNDSQKRVPVTVNLGADQRDRVRQLALAEGRSVSAIVRRALARAGGLRTRSLGPRRLRPRRKRLRVPGRRARARGDHHQHTATVTARARTRSHLRSCARGRERVPALPNQRPGRSLQPDGKRLRRLQRLREAPARLDRHPAPTHTRRQLPARPRRSQQPTPPRPDRRDRRRRVLARAPPARTRDPHRRPRKRRAAAVPANDRAAQRTAAHRPWIAPGETFRAPGAFSATLDHDQLHFTWTDTTKPTAPHISNPDLVGPAARRLRLNWTDASDRGSGISHYTLSLDRTATIRTGAQAEATLPRPTAGEHTITVVAFDRAGNHSHPTTHHFHTD